MTMVFVPSAGANVQGLGPFVGQWGGAYRYGLTISPDGSGRYSGPDSRSARRAPCPMRPAATIDFVLASVSGTTATGTVSSVRRTAGGQSDAVGGKT